jgi:hypothetical protein
MMVMGGCVVSWGSSLILASSWVSFAARARAKSDHHHLRLPGVAQLVRHLTRLGERAQINRAEPHHVRPAVLLISENPATPSVFADLEIKVVGNAMAAVLLMLATARSLIFSLMVTSTFRGSSSARALVVH